MTTSITVYDKTTGRITAVIRCTADMVDAQTVSSAEAMLVGTESNPITQYVVNGRVAARPSNTATLSGTTIYNVPAGASVRIDDSSPVKVESGTAYLTPTAGSRSVRVVAPWPMKEARFEFTI